MKSIKTLLAALALCGLLTGCQTSKQVGNVGNQVKEVATQTASIVPTLWKDGTQLWNGIVDFVKGITDGFKSAPAPVPVAQ